MVGMGGYVPRGTTIVSPATTISSQRLPRRSDETVLRRPQIAGASSRVILQGTNDLVERQGQRALLR
jgi:hypothetical protein